MTDHKVATVTAPAGEPVTIEEAKLHIRATSDDEDPLINSLITAARQFVEEQLWRALMTQTLRYTLDAWPSSYCVQVPKPPLQSVTSVQYTLEGDAAATFAASNYIVDTAREPGQIALRTTSTGWPSGTLQTVNGIEIVYIAGYGGAESVPEAIKHAIKLIIGHWYENRESVIVGAGLASAQVAQAFDALTSIYKVR